MDLALSGARQQQNPEKHVSLSVVQPLWAWEMAERTPDFVGLLRSLGAQSVFPAVLSSRGTSTVSYQSSAVNLGG